MTDANWCDQRARSVRVAHGCWLVMFATPPYAELPSIRFDRLQPLGLAAGGSVEVRSSATIWKDFPSLRFDQPGLTAEPIAGKGRWFKITAAADVPRERMTCGWSGGSASAVRKLFAVQQGLAEVPEVEPNNEADQSQVVQVNCVDQRHVRRREC